MNPRVETHIRLSIRSVFPSDQSPCSPHEETFGPYLPIAKRTFADFYFSQRFFFFRAKGVPRQNAKKEFFSWADLCIICSLTLHVMY